MKAKYGVAVGNFAGRVMAMRYRCESDPDWVKEHPIDENEMTPAELIYYYWRYDSFLGNRPALQSGISK